MTPLTEFVFPKEFDFFFYLHLAACGILLPSLGIKPMPLAEKVWNLNHQTAREVPGIWFFKISLLSASVSVSQSVQSLSHVWLFATPWTRACQASLSITNSQSLLKLMSIELVMPPNHLILSHPLLLLPSIFPNIRVFSNVSSSHQVAKVLEFQLQHQSFQWIFRTDFLEDGLAGSPCSPKDSRESSPTPQFKSLSYLTQLPI